MEVRYMQVIPCSCGCEEMCFCGRCKVCGKQRSSESEVAGRQCTGLWRVCTKGGPNSKHFEIAVVREDNIHGRDSFGWFDPDKKIMVASSGGPCSNEIVSSWLWQALLWVAENLAVKLNGNSQAAIDKEVPIG